MQAGAFQSRPDQKTELGKIDPDYFGKIPEVCFVFTRQPMEDFILAGVTMKTAICAVTLSTGLTLMAGDASAKTNCDAVAGSWSGTMQGSFNGVTSMTIDGTCKVNWTLPDGRTNKCKFSARSGQIEYSCSLGSHGSVTFGRNSITLENIYTAARHGAYKVQVSRAK